MLRAGGLWFVFAMLTMAALAQTPGTSKPLAPDGLTPPPAGSPPAPQPAPGGNFYIWYGAVPPGGQQAPVIVFVPGLGADASYFWLSNDPMYNAVYAAGYRSAFVCFTPQCSSQNDFGIVHNGNILKSVLPQIANFYGVSQIYAVGHSKGGLDLQAALKDPAIQKIVKAVFTLGSPNQGTELSDWAYGPGGAIAATFGLLTPAVYDMRLNFMANFRAEMDPILAAAHIPFYTMAGKKHGFNPVLIATGVILSNLTNGEDNDGLVPVDRTSLPSSYSMDLGSVPQDHFRLGHGSVAFPMIQGQIEGLELRQGTFQRVSTGGFGDKNNTWAWSMKWFKGKLYVGTGRQVNCAILATALAQEGLAVYPPRSLDCTPDYHDLSLQAEIWQYTPETKSWLRVFQSPLTVPTVGLDGVSRMQAYDMGFRGMAIFTEADGTQALYVSGVSARSVFSQGPPYPATTDYPPPRMLRSVDGVNWIEVPHDPGTFLGDIVKNNTDVFVVGYRTMEVVNGTLYVAATDFKGMGFIIASKNPSAGNNAWTRISPTFDSLPVWVFKGFNNALYVGTGIPGAGSGGVNGGYGLYKSTLQGNPPYTFTPIIEQGGWQTVEKLRSDSALSMTIYNGQLYMGTNRRTELVKVDTSDNWQLVVGEPRSTPGGYKAPLSGIGQGFGNAFNEHFWNLGVDGKNRLYVGTWDSSVGLNNISLLLNLFNPQFGFDLYRSSDGGTTWQSITRTGFGDGWNFGGRSVESTPFGFFVGTARPIGGCQVWWDNSVLDFNNDGIVDQKDVDMVMSAMDQRSSGPSDLRDVDGDGQITVLDARKIALQCTYPNCASAPPANAPASIRPPLTAVPPPANLRSTQGTMAIGTPVSLTWDPSPGAVRYHVYRWTNQTVPEFLKGQNVSATLPFVNIPVSLPGDALNGKLDFACKMQSISDMQMLCDVVTSMKAANNPAASTSGPPAGFLAPLVEAGQVTGTTFTEPAATELQSMYFVRAEDALGNLTDSSNLVGGPAK